jgi:NitT/TauT family transport system permease protein
MRTFRAVLPPLVVVAMLLMLWEGVVVLWKVPRYLLPSPLAVLDATWDDRGRMLAAAWQTTLASVGGFGLAVSIGVLLGSLLGTSRTLQRGFYPIALLLQMVPLVAIAPLLVLWFGYGLRSTIASACIVSVFPVLASTLDGLRGTDPGLQEIFTIHRAGRFTRWWKLELPSSLPSIVTGCRVAAGLSVIGAVVGEFVSGYAGDNAPLGIVIVSGMRETRTDLVFAAVALSACAGFLLFAIVSALGWLLLRRWHASAVKEN